MRRKKENKIKEKKSKKGKQGKKKRGEEERKEKSQIKIPKDKPKLTTTKKQTSCIFLFVFVAILNFFFNEALLGP